MACASMFNSGKQRVTLTTGDSKLLKVKVTDSNGENVTTAPGVVDVEPMMWEYPRVQVIEKCFESNSINIKRSIDGTFWLNIFNFFMFSAVDMLTGSIWNLEDETKVPLVSNGVCK